MGQRLIIQFLCLFIGGCINNSNINIAHTPTHVEPLPLKLSLKNSSTTIAIPIVTEKKKTGGYRSPVEIKFEVMLTQFVGINMPILPNGIIVGPRIRW